MTILETTCILLHPVFVRFLAVLGLLDGDFDLLTASGEDSTFTNGKFAGGEAWAWPTLWNPPDPVVPEAVDLGPSSSVHRLISFGFLGLETMSSCSTETVSISGRAFGKFGKDSITNLESIIDAPFASGNAEGYEACEIECCGVILFEASGPILIKGSFQVFEVPCSEKKIGLTPAAL